MVLYFGMFVKLEAGQEWDYFCLMKAHAMQPKHVGIRFYIIFNRLQTNESVVLQQ